MCMFRYVYVEIGMFPASFKVNVLAWECANCRLSDRYSLTVVKPGLVQRLILAEHGTNMSARILCI